MKENCRKMTIQRLLITILIIIIIIIIILSSVTVFAGVLFVNQSGTKHAPGESVTQVSNSVHTPRTFLRIRADPSKSIFWVSVTVAI